IRPRYTVRSIRTFTCSMVITRLIQTSPIRPIRGTQTSRVCGIWATVLPCRFLTARATETVLQTWEQLGLRPEKYPEGQVRSTEHLSVLKRLTRSTWGQTR